MNPEWIKATNQHLGRKDHAPASTAEAWDHYYMPPKEAAESIAKARLSPTSAEGKQ